MGSAKGLLQLLYWIVLLAGCIILFNANYLLSSILRDLLMPILVIYLFASLKPTHSKTLKTYFLLALFFLWIADIINGFINTDYFEPNVKDPYLYAFLAVYGIANVFFVLAYNRIKKINLKETVKASFTLLLGIILVYLVYFKLISSGIIQGNKPPFIAFTFSLILVASMAANITDSNTKRKLAFNYFIPAAILSILSFTIYAFNKYGLRENRVESIVMLMYGYAQILNINGFRKTSR